MAGQQGTEPFQVVHGSVQDPYRSRVERVYEDRPEVWKKAIGDSLLFHLGIYPDGASSLEEAGICFLEHTLELADVEAPVRVLDVGCGWGSVLQYLAERFADCPRLDGINISAEQLAYAAAGIRRSGLDGRVRLFLCNAQDVRFLPGPETPYDLVMARGSVAHFPPAVLRGMAEGLAQRVRRGGKLIVADVFYNDVASYVSSIEDTVDRCACGYRKSPDQVTGLLEECGFLVDDVRVLPDAKDTVRWFRQVQANMDAHWAAGERPRALDEYYITFSNMIAAVERGAVSAYSIIARRG
ncbi:hypothetical protein SUDANB180_07552 [Streptomyces sp. enrichment culture]|uniref:SAM-dependent methyltransferase n=1 Tax=Streptomyces sp. enrichment culture TaxID=1795815 RepID=UPI003F564B25